jgi:hypothetical protein
MSTAEQSHAELVREVKRLKRRCPKLEELVETAWYDGHVTANVSAPPMLRSDEWVRSQTLGALRRTCGDR